MEARFWLQKQLKQYTAFCFAQTLNTCLHFWPKTNYKWATASFTQTLSLKQQPTAVCLTYNDTDKCC